MIPLLAPNLFLQHFAATGGSSKQAFESWEGLSFEEQVKRATVVLVTENKQEGGKIRAIVKEI